jgi:hypothetical protein
MASFISSIETGIFIIPGFNFDTYIQNSIEPYFSFKDEETYLGSYGVCDNVQQVKDKYSKWLENLENRFCISFTRVRKSEQSPQGGWRWHKWGGYIGEKNPQMEYLYDEDDSIEEVYCYHIYQLLD